MNAPLPPRTLPVSRTLMIAASFATRDYHPVHHDDAWSQAHGLPGAMLNAVTVEGLILQYVGDVTGRFDVIAHEVRLLAPTHAGDTLSFSGTRDGATIEVEAANPRGRCAMATVTLA